MQKEEHKILAINPGSRYVSIAFFLGTELRDWAIKVIRKEKRMIDHISEYTHRYGITAFAVKKLHPSRTSKLLHKAVTSLRNYINTHVGCLYEYSIDDVKRSLLSGKRKNKELLMEEIGLRYPFLSEEIRKEETNKNPYRMRMFEAIGIGMCCLEEIDTEESKVAKEKNQIQ